MTQRDDLVEAMLRLAERAQELAEEHAKIVEEFVCIQEQLEELDRKQSES